MPDTGVPAHRPHQSHTGTQQWQSFEIRMRYRRAERCVLKAEAALDAGMEEEARAALAEARALNPDAPGFEALMAASRARRQSAAEALKRQRTKRVSLAAAMLALAGFGGTWAYQSRQAIVKPEAPEVSASSQANGGVTAPDPALQASAAGASPSMPAADALPQSIPPPVAPPPQASADPGSAVSPASAPAAAAREVLVPFQPVMSGPPAPEPVPAPTPTTGDALAQPPPVSDATTIERVGRAVAAPPAPVAPPSAPPSAPVPDSPAPVEPQEPAVRAVLARFEAAYSSLSAGAAQEVWPSVDAAALARAFDDLESQRVSLGNCSVTMDAATAQASCTGSTTWTPRVGGGARTQTRRWQFELALANGAWRIVRAQAR